MRQIIALEMKRKVQTENSGSKNRVVECAHCLKRMRSDKLGRHMATHNIKKICKYCKKDVRIDRLSKHEVLCRAKVDEKDCDRYVGVHQHIENDAECTSVMGYFNSYNLSIEDSSDYDVILDEACKASKPKLKEYISKHPIKAQIVITLLFYKNAANGNREESEKAFRSFCEPLLVGDKIVDFLTRTKETVRIGIEQYERCGSGWIFDKHCSSKLEIAKYSPLSASGSVYIPKKLKNIRSVLNIKSKDNKCFLYCLLAKLYSYDGPHPDRYTKYLDHVDKINMGGAEFPVKIKDITKIEKLNNISISVFQWYQENEWDECIVPLRHGCGDGTQIDLLYIEDDETAHYMLIKNFNGFMRLRTKHHNTMYFCRKCLHGFVKKEKQEEHSYLCNQGINQFVMLPSSGAISFKATFKQDRKLFALYFDFECLTIPYSTCYEDQSKSSTTKYQKHVPCSFCIVTTSAFSQYERETVVFSNPDPKTVTKKFIEELTRIHKDMMICYNQNSFPIDMTDEDEGQFKSSTHCHICNKELCWKSDTNYPVRDHDHTKEHKNFRGAACNVCNINYFNRTKKIPAFAHNLKGYDMNLFLLDLIKDMEKIDIIPENLEKFKAVFTENYIFLDSFAFLSSSLDKLAKNLKQSGSEQFKHLKKEFPENYKLLSEKGVYFYDYASSYSVFSEKVLPPKKSFFNQLKEEHISDEDYDKAQTVFKATNCKSLLDYMEIYVKTDTLILCDVFENFRDLCLNYYGIDPCHYMSLPAFAWDAMLKMTGVKLEYITDIEQYTFIEENLRGGVSTINHRLFTANNKYLDDYNPNEPTSYIKYIDANNLYGASMMKKLPVGNFRWLKNYDIVDLDMLNLDPDGDTCYILEVDLHYPDNVHDKHTDYPLAVEKKIITGRQLCPVNKEFLRINNEKFKSSTKLVPDLSDKLKYVCSLRNLQLFLKLGLVLKKIHRVLAADQTDFMTSYISFNSSKRQVAESDFEKNFFKLLNNAVYGKFIESVRKRTNVDVVKDTNKANKLTSKPQFLGFHILDEEVTLVQCVKRKLMLNKPIVCGYMVLENAKNIMYDFWYNVLKPMYADKVKLILSDTDSFVYGVYTEDSYLDLYNNRHYMDLSGYDHCTVLGKFYDKSNKKIPGKFSDEKPLHIIKEVVALKPKMYSILTQKLHPEGSCSTNHFATAKGVPGNAKKKITHEDYKSVLMNLGTNMTTSKTIRTFNNKLYSVRITKRGLSAYDDKKFILEDKVSTLSYGHFRLRN